MDEFGSELALEFSDVLVRAALKDRDPPHMKNAKTRLILSRAIMGAALWSITTALLFNKPAVACSEPAFTNWDGLHFGLCIAGTNFTSTDEIYATIIVSNALNAPRELSWSDGDPCGTGFKFGGFLITNLTIGKLVSCSRPFDERVGFMGRLATIDPHQIFEPVSIDLMRGFPLTNVGTYSIQAQGNFKSLASPDSVFTLTSPPLLITVRSTNGPAGASERVETNPASLHPPPKEDKEKNPNGSVAPTVPRSR
jgi:hypothetical protein